MLAIFANDLCASEDPVANFQALQERFALPWHRKTLANALFSLPSLFFREEQGRTTGDGLFLYQGRGVSHAYFRSKHFRWAEGSLSRILERSEGMEVLVLFCPSKESVHRATYRRLYPDGADVISRREATANC